MRSRVCVISYVVLGMAFLFATVSAHATFPGQNGLIAFSVDTGAGFQIYTVRPNGDALRQITNVSGDALFAEWSPDGRQLVFELDTPESASIAIMNSDGTGPVTMPPAPNGFEGQPAFTPDGKHIVFERFVFDPCCDDAIWVMDLDGNNRQRIASAPAGATDPNVSPDGKTVSFVGFNGEPTGAALFTSSISGGDPLQLTPFKFDVAIKQDWAPDGRRLVFTKNGAEPKPGVSPNIVTVRPDGTHLRRLTHYEGGDISAFVGSYSPDGQWIVFRLEDHGQFGLFKMHTDGSHVRPILPLSDFKPRFIAWGPRPQRHN
jgi:Tol biopolymer transport system component